MRLDLAEAMAATRPSIWRFPGGNNLEVGWVCLVRSSRDAQPDRELALILDGNGMRQLGGADFWHLLNWEITSLHRLEDRPGRTADWCKFPISSAGRISLTLPVKRIRTRMDLYILSLM